MDHSKCCHSKATIVSAFLSSARITISTAILKELNHQCNMTFHIIMYIISYSYIINFHIIMYIGSYSYEFYAQLTAHASQSQMHPIIIIHTIINFEYAKFESEINACYHNYRHS